MFSLHMNYFIIFVEYYKKMSEIKVFVEQSYVDGRVKIWAISHRGDKRINYGPNCVITEQEAHCVNSAEPLLEIPSYLSKHLLIAITEALNKEGVRLESDSVIEGKYKAQSEHLKDMRSIVGKMLKVDLNK